MGKRWFAAAMRWLVMLGMIAMLSVMNGCMTMPARSAAAPLTLAVPVGTVVLYAKAGCPYCQQAKEYLTKQRITFVVRDIERDATALEEMRTLYRQRLPDQRMIVPLIVAGERLTSGFDPDELADLLHMRPDYTVTEKGQ